MKTRSSASKRAIPHARPRIVSGDLVRSRSDEIADAVARRAYDLYERRGREHGHHDEDWRQAQSELVFPVAVTVSDAGTRLTVEAAVPGFDACDVEVCVEPRRITIAGLRKSGVAPGAAGSLWMYRAVELPDDVSVCDVVAVVKEGVVAVTLRKVRAPEAELAD
jgi:HSP20 family molecular chaperone IbpA